VLGVASDLVKVSGSSQKLLTFLLGQVVIVKDRHTARDLVKSLPAFGKAVTLKGEVFTGSGVIIAGKENRSSIISRPRQKKDLEDRINELEALRIVKQQELYQLQSEIKALAGKRKDLEEGNRENQSNLQQANADYSTAEREVAQLQQQLEWQNSQISTLESQTGKTETEISASQTDIDNNDNEITRLNVMLRETSTALRSIPIEELQSQLVHWNTTLAISERAAREIDNRYLELENTINQNTSLINQTRKRIEDLNVLRVEAENSKQTQNLKKKA